jgi:hypothetical protein
MKEKEPKNAEAVIKDVDRQHVVRQHKVDISVTKQSYT